MIFCVFLFYLNHAFSVFASKSFIHTVFHDVTKLMKLRPVVGYGIIVAYASDFTVVLVEDIDILFTA